MLSVWLQTQHWGSNDGCSQRATQAPRNSRKFWGLDLFSVIGDGYAVCATAVPTAPAEAKEGGVRAKVDVDLTMYEVVDGEALFGTVEKLLCEC